MLLLLVPPLTRVQRHRLRAARVFIPEHPKRRDWLTPQGLVAGLRSQPFWRQAAYHLLVGPLLAIAAAIALALWLGGLLSAIVYLYGWGLRPDSRFPARDLPAGRLHRAVRGPRPGRRVPDRGRDHRPGVRPHR